MALSPGALKILTQLAILGLSQLMLIYGAKWLWQQLDPEYERKKKAAEVGSKLVKRLQAKKLELNEYENQIASDVIDPVDLKEGWSRIGGLEDVVQVLKESVVLPLSRPDLFPSGSSILRAPKGVLFHGPPGCGKTLLARVLAKESDCCFMSLQPSSFMNKWFGESQKLVDAVFSLATKLQPIIIFIDEIDAFLRVRSSMDSEATAQIKAQFMLLWDGFSTEHNSQVVVVGATNRPGDIDIAIVRRMPIRCHVGLPNQNQRLSILKTLLRNENVSGKFELDKVAEGTEGFSGSDLQELCRTAAMTALRSTVNLDSPKKDSSSSHSSVALTTSDFMKARESVHKQSSVDDFDE
eukprot:m.111989 g.111989  ORF g.111989 m.111989 type:complete len:352 (+) comp14078_c0_seq1:31-1086(+)